jgi:hypothetical protein
MCACSLASQPAHHYLCLRCWRRSQRIAAGQLTIFDLLLEKAA